jgi:uncharacterized flavoprotein (TIGR03862 family)
MTRFRAKDKRPVPDSDDLTLAAGRRVAVIGAGPAGLMAAEMLARAGATVTVYDRMASPGRKFLMAGRGGLNLTHSEDLTAFVGRYGETHPLLRGAIEAFPPAALRAWSDSLGQPTFVGSSGRVFPTALKTSPLLRTWLLRLGNLGVNFKLRHRWMGWDDEGSLRFAAGNKEVMAEPDATILALGGASWPKLGSDAAWADIVREQDIAVSPLRPANCGFTAAWSEVFQKFEGQPLKRIALTFAGRSVRGEAMITRAGLEGGAVYALSSPIRAAIERDGKAVVTVDLLPDVSPAKLRERLSGPRGKQSLSNFLRKATHLSAAALALLREAALTSGQSLSAMKAEQLAGLVKAAPVRLTGVQPIETAISTAGGVCFVELDEGFMLKRYPGIFVAGEMLDWDAPTGGYLLQASFATAVAAARGAVKWLKKG